MTHAPGPYVPDRFLPEGEVTLGDPDPVSASPDADIDWPRCDCGGVLVGCESDNTMTCNACGREELTEAGRQRRREQRRESRLRDAHNHGSFLPKSVGEWRERRGDRR